MSPEALLVKKLDELGADVKELIRQGAEHNVLLKTHEARSLALQQEQKLQAKDLEPIKKHVDFVTFWLKAFGAIATGVVVKLIISKLF